MALSETSICNMALAKIGSKRINNITDATLEAIHARLHYEQARDSLLRLGCWRFATARAVLSQDTTAPAFEWDAAFILPSDFLKLKSLYGTSASYALEGNRLLTNDGEASLVYIRKVTDPVEFDALFVECLVLSLAVRLVMPLAQDKSLLNMLHGELSQMLMQAKTTDRQEQNTVGRTNLGTWNDARGGSVDPAHMGS